MEPVELTQRVNLLEKTIRNMRIAVIIIAAFFLYESIAPAGFGQMDVRVMEKVKLKELMVLDENNQMRVRLSVAEDGPQLLLEDPDSGQRVVLTNADLSILQASEQGYRRALYLDKEGLH